MHKLILGATGAVAAAALVGCGAGLTTTGGATPLPAPQTTVTVTPAAPSRDDPTSASAPTTAPTDQPSRTSAPASPSGGATSSAKLPPKFPLPKGAAVTFVANDGGQIAAQITISDAGQAFSFWRSALPDAGYKVTKAESIGGFGEIRLSGHGCGGNSQIAISNTTASLQCDLT